MEKSHAKLFVVINVFPETSLNIYGRLLSVVREARFLGMIFDKRLTWVPHLKSLRLACQSPLNLLRHLSHTTWGVDTTILLRLYLVLLRSKLDYGAHAYCTTYPRSLRILGHVQNKGLRLVKFVLL